MPPSDDLQLAERLICADGAAVEELRQRFAARFAHADESLRGSVPACAAALDELLPFAAAAVGCGYKRFADNELSLDAHVASLRLDDLLLVSACLAGDGAAWRRLRDLIDRHVAEPLRRKLAPGVDRQTVEAALGELLGYCFEPTAKGDRVGRPRLAAYLGVASLGTWLFAVAVRLAQAEARAVRREPRGGETVAVATGALPELTRMLEESASRGNEIRTALTDALRPTVERMPPRRRLAAVLHWGCGDRPADIALRMRVSRPRVSQLLNEAREELLHAARPLLAAIAREADRRPADVERLFLESLPALHFLPASASNVEGRAR